MPLFSKAEIKETEEVVEHLKELSVVIYNNIVAIEAEKGTDSLWPEELFRHDFEKNKGDAKIYGLADGSLLITGNKKLWKVFDYD